MTKQKQRKQTPWPESGSKRCRSSDRLLLAKLVPTFADRGSYVFSVTSLRPYSWLFRPEPLLFLSSSSSIVNILVINQNTSPQFLVFRPQILRQPISYRVCTGGSSTSQSCQGRICMELYRSFSIRRHGVVFNEAQ
jgi:hypothetical protein